jgi:hypothetical protein
VPLSNSISIQKFDYLRLCRREIIGKYKIQILISKHISGSRIEREVQIYATGLAKKPSSSEFYSTDCTSGRRYMFPQIPQLILCIVVHGLAFYVILCD